MLLITISVISSMIAISMAQILAYRQMHLRRPYPPDLIIIEGEVSYVNKTLWIGLTKYKQYSEPFCPIAWGSVSFTSWHGTPTGWQNMYIFANKTAPVALTTPHGHYVPPGASDFGFGFDIYGNWTFKGQNKFVVCQTKEQLKRSPDEGYQIWWKGAGSVPGVNCSEPISLIRDDRDGSCGSNY